MYQISATKLSSLLNLKVVSTGLNMHHILSSIILCSFLSFPVNIHPIESSMSTETNRILFKDIIFAPELNLSARLYRPKDTAKNQKLPLVFHVHGGGFDSGSPFAPIQHHFTRTLVAEANISAISIEYRLIQVCHLPCAYNDSWAELKWVASHLKGNGPEVWLNQHVDFHQVYITGESAGANIAHQTAMKLSTEKNIEGFGLAGLILYHPLFWGSKRLPGETPKGNKNVTDAWRRACPTSSGIDDPWINPAKDPNLAGMAFPRLQVFVSENDEYQLRERGWYYAQKLRESGWSGYQEVIDFQGERHAFHFFDLTSRNSTILRNRVVAFINSIR